MPLTDDDRGAGELESWRGGKWESKSTCWAEDLKGVLTLQPDGWRRARWQGQVAPGGQLDKSADVLISGVVKQATFFIIL